MNLLINLSVCDFAFWHATCQNPAEVGVRWWGVTPCWISDSSRMGDDTKGHTLSVYSARAHEGKAGNWIEIGLALPHRDGKGFDVVLNALPLDAKLILRATTDTKRHDIERLSLAQQVDAFERDLIEQALAEAGGRISPVLDRLAIPRRTLSEKMSRLGIDRRRIARNVRPNHAHKLEEIGSNLPKR
jgi:hypothetical protein